MAGALFLDAQTCPQTKDLDTSSLSSIPGTRGFRIGVVLLIYWLPIEAAEPSGARWYWKSQSQLCM